jgi:hypothetical protein
MNRSELAPVEWIVSQPGGPSGPFHSIVATSGKVIALQVPDREVAARIARIPLDDAQDRRLVADLEAIRNAIALVSPSLLNDTMNTLNFWISVYSKDNDGL